MPNFNLDQYETVETRLAKFWAKVDKDGPGGCWLWTGAHRPEGYGTVRVQGKYWRTHRLAYTALVGPIPDGLQLDHLCRVPACVNPSHLEPVTNRENSLRGVGPTAVRARQTHCIHGHALSGENLYITPRDGYRACKTCRSERQKARRAALNGL